MSDAQALISRLEAATGADRESDARLWLEVGEELGCVWSWTQNLKEPLRPSEVINGRTMAQALELFPNDISGICHSWRVPHFTTSIDAAMTLVPEGHTWARDADGLYAVYRRNESMHDYVSSSRSFPAAILRAIEASKLPTMNEPGQANV